jgi:hypothetical protein
MLSAIVGIVMIRAKEMVVLNGMNLMMLMLIITSYMYTLQYVNKVIMTSWVGEMEGIYVMVLIMISIIVIELNFSVWVGLIIGIVVISWLGNPMNTLV